jgi:hypothetical protein
MGKPVVATKQLPWNILKIGFIWQRQRLFKANRKINYRKLYNFNDSRREYALTHSWENNVKILVVHCNN